MKTLSLHFAILIFFTLQISFGQVGVNNTDPQATLDITATNQANPINNEGVLVPRINQFPTVNPTAAQHSMLVFLTTTVGTNTPGYYYWNQPTTSWISLSGSSFWERDATGFLFPQTATDKIELYGNHTATGSTNTGSLEIDNRLRLDRFGLTTNTNSTLYLNYDNDADISLDSSTIYLDANTNRVGIGHIVPTSKLDIRNPEATERGLYVSKGSGAEDAARIYHSGTGSGLTVQSFSPTPTITATNSNSGFAISGYGSATGNGGVLGISGAITNTPNLLSTGVTTQFIEIGAAGTSGGGEYVGIEGRANFANTSTSDRIGGVFYVSNFSSGSLGAIAAVGSIVNNISFKIMGIGIVSTLVKDDNGEQRVMVAPEAPEALFQDFGTGTLINGMAFIKIDPIFTKNITVNEQHPLRVFIQLEGDCKGVFVTNKSATGFEVRELNNGTSNISFSYQIVANRANEIQGGHLSRYEDMRFMKLKRKIK